MCDAGVPAESLVSVRHYVDNSPEPGALLHESLDNIFYGEMPFSGGQHSRCAAYDTVRLRGTLSDEDLLLAFVQTAYRGEASINGEVRGSDVRFSLNDLGERLVRSGRRSERRELRALLPADLQLWTYDDIVERARRCGRMLPPGAALPGGQ